MCCPMAYQCLWEGPARAAGFASFGVDELASVLSEVIYMYSVLVTAICVISACGKVQLGQQAFVRSHFLQCRHQWL